VNPITITVNAQTAEAAAQLQKFVLENSAGLKTLAAGGHEASEAFHQVRESAMLAREGMHAAETGAMLLGGEKMEGLVRGVMLGREALLATRSAAMLFGTTLLEMAPWLAVAAAAVGGAIYVWNEFSGAEKKAEEQTKKTVEELGKIPAILEQINLLEAAKIITPEDAANRRKDVATKHYRQPDGQIVTEPDTGQMEATDPLGLRGPSFQKYHVQNTPLTLEEENKYQAAKTPDVPKEALDNLAKLREATRQAHEEAMDDIAREKAANQNKYEADKKNLEDRLATAQTVKSAGGLSLVGPNEVADIRRAMVDLDTAKARKDAEIDSKAAAAKQKLLDEAQRRADEATHKQMELDRTLAAARKNAWEGLEHQLADDQQATREATTDKTKALYPAEYDQKVSLAFSAKTLGLINEREYQDYVAKAQKERIAGEREYRAELEKVAALKQEIARGDLEAKIKDVQGSQFSTQSEKDAQLIPLYEQMQAANQERIKELEAIHAQTTDVAAQLEAEKQITELKRQQAEISDKMLAAQKSQNPVVAFGSMFANLRDQAEINFSTLATTFQNVFNTAVQSISHGITGLIEGTMTWGQALRSIANSILNEVISAIVQMGVRYLLTQAIMAIGGRAIMASAMAATAPLAMAQSAIWAAPATLATIATLGAAAVAAPGFIGGAEAMTLGLGMFATGGYTGAGGVFEPAGIVHKGEYVFSQAAVNRIGVPVLDAMHNHAAGGGASGATGAAVSNKTNLAVYGFTDPNQMMEHFHKSDAHEAYVVDVMARNAHRLSR